MTLPSVSDIALKEWAVAVKSLGRGEQIIALRKGGIHREDRDFRFVHPEFLLFPTYEHQKAELIKSELPRHPSRYLRTKMVPAGIGRIYLLLPGYG